MKHYFLLLFLPLLLYSCMFSKQTAFIAQRRTMPEKQIIYTSEDSIRAVFDADALLRYLRHSHCSDSTKKNVRAYLISPVVNFDSLEAQLYKFNDCDCGNFWMRQLKKGKVYLLDLSTGKPIRHIKRETRYFHESFFSRKKMYIEYSYHDKFIYQERYLIVDF